MKMGGSDYKIPFSEVKLGIPMPVRKLTDPLPVFTYSCGSFNLFDFLGGKMRTSLVLTRFPHVGGTEQSDWHTVRAQ